MTGEQAKRAFERSSPYVSWANLVVLAGLIFTGVQAGIINFSADDQAPRQVGNLSKDIDELKRTNERQDVELKSTERWVGQRLQRIENKVDHIYELLIRRDAAPAGPRGPS